MKTCVLSVVAIAVSLAARNVQARSLLYYCDFEQVADGALVYSDINKGSGTAVFILKEKSAGLGAGYSAGAHGSAHAFCSTTQNSLWLGDGTASLGCGTAHGFTISFWLKTAAPSKAWYDFMGFRVGGTDYRCEYPKTTSGEFQIYADGSSRLMNLDGTDGGTAYTTAGKWEHVAFVFSPGTNGGGSARCTSTARRRTTCRSSRLATFSR